jgi:hypothetical protein
MKLKLSFADSFLSERFTLPGWLNRYPNSEQVTVLLHMREEGIELRAVTNHDDFVVRPQL